MCVCVCVCVCVENKNNKKDIRALLLGTFQTSTPEKQLKTKLNWHYKAVDVTKGVGKGEPYVTLELRMSLNTCKL